MIEYKEIQGYDGFYLIGNDGNILSMPRKFSPKKMLLENAFDDNGYPQTAIQYKRKLKTFKLHRLVAEYFIPKPEGVVEVNHIDGNKKNNHVSNLEWCTRSQNVQHAYDIGIKFVAKGEAHPNSRLKNNEVIDIRSLHKSGIKKRLIADKFNVSFSTIKRIVSRELWNHI